MPSELLVPVSRLLRRLTPRLAPDAVVPDLVFVLPPPTAQGWILDAICREIAQRLPRCTIGYARFTEPLPPARRYFFSHYIFFIRSLSLLSPMHRAHSCVYATHLEPAKHGLSNRQIARFMSLAQSVICMNSGLRDELAALGVPPTIMTVVPGAASRAEFRPHERTPSGAVGLSSAFYPRKSPDLIFDLVRGLPQRRFILLGKGWDKYARYAALRALPNFEYVETAYEQYPAYYAQMSVFVSPSRLEGGPIPLLEAMMSNVVPVASRTGFAPDIISHGHNGFLFDLDAPADDVCRLIEKAYSLATDVSSTVTEYDWDPFARRISHVLGVREQIADAAQKVAAPHGR